MKCGRDAFWKGAYSMWTRKELKEKAKAALKRNYWKTVLVSLLLILLGGGFSGFSSSGISSNTADSVAKQSGTQKVEQDSGNLLIETYETDDGEEIISNAAEGIMSAGEEEQGKAGYMMMVVIAVAVFAAVFLIVFVILFVIDAFIYNPIIVGAERFMLKNMDDKAEVKEVVYGFDHSYINIVKTMFFRELYVFLWTLLFIIPGVYKKYQYRLVPYILAEHPETDYKEALQLSKEMMNGEKWHAFVLDLSFIPWHILGTITCGILEVFYIAPYQNLTNAELFCTVAARHGEAGRQDMVPMLEDTETGK